MLDILGQSKLHEAGESSLLILLFTYVTKISIRGVYDYIAGLACLSMYWWSFGSRIANCRGIHYNIVLYFQQPNRGKEGAAYTFCACNIFILVGGDNNKYNCMTS